MLAWWQINWRQMKKHILGKHRTAAQHKIANIPVFNFFAQRFVDVVKSMVLSFSANPTKRPTGVRKKGNQEELSPPICLNVVILALNVVILALRMVSGRPSGPGPA